MTPQDVILMLALQLAETTVERDAARQKVLQLEAEKKNADSTGS